MQRVCIAIAIAVGLIVPSLNPRTLGDEGAKKDVRRTYEQMVAKATAFLSSKGQAPDGSFSSQAGPAVTGICVTALLRSGKTPDDIAVRKGLKYLESFVQPDGGIYQRGSVYQNYETCIAVLCFSEANHDGHYKDVISRADSFVKGLQWDETENVDRADMRFGGAGYGNSKRPDLSNTAYLVDALQAAGNSPNDPAIQEALLFVSRCQNLESEHNTTPFATLNPDGGFYYTVAAGGQSQAGQLENGGLRSYGSMTYAGLKSMIFAGLTADDERVKAAYEWICKNYDVTTNPGMGNSGLYYYYHTFAKALDAMHVDALVDSKGASHDWRAELIAQLRDRQQADGSWVNENARWLESDPNLVTAYSLLALSYSAPRE